MWRGWLVSKIAILNFGIHSVFGKVVGVMRERRVGKEKCPHTCCGKRKRNGRPRGGDLVRS